MNGVFYPAAAAVAWTALVYGLVRGPRDAARYTVCTAFALMGIIFTVSTPVVWAAIDEAVAVPNLSLLISQGGVIAFSGTIQCLIVFWTTPRAAGWRRARWRIVWVLAVLAAMTWLFLRAERYDERPTDAAATYADDPAYAVYLGCYITMVAIGVLDIIRLCLPYARHAGRSWLARGLRLTSIGACFGLLYCGIRATTLVEGQLGTDPRRLEALVPPVAALGAMLIVIGLTLPSLGPRLSRLAGWQAQRRAYRGLLPLWEAVSVTVTEVVLDPSAPRAFVVRRVERRLRRRVVEIGDGLRQLRLPAAPEAARVVAACAAHEAARRAESPDAAREARWDAWWASLPTSPPPAPVERPEPVDFAAEVEWLVAVSRALRAPTEEMVNTR